MRLRPHQCKKNLPFTGVPVGKSVSKMTIKAIGTVVENPGNGQRVIVSWDKSYEPKDWYFFTYRSTFWRVNEQGQWWQQYGSKLIDFAFFDKPQDYAFFVKNWSWNQSVEGEEGSGIGFSREVLNLNTILYGPPGTGKTFNTVDLALSILEPNATTRPGSIQELKSRFPGQIEFVTFHQSFSYEDFVEGIQAKTQDGKISYEVEDGVFKSLCKKAARIYTASTASFEDALEQLKIKASEESVACKTVTGKKFWFTYQGATTFSVIPESSVEKFGLEGAGTGYPVKISQLRELFDEPDKKDGLYNSSYTKGILKFLIEQYGIKKSQKTEMAEQKPHVLIIDEINRGNISRIFGELITLIEPSKRAGNDEAIEVTLPYSKEPFSVPNNLYIIGTMNTADRSLALMDTALRRRFDFIEMMPLPGLVTDDLEGVNVRKMLEVMNQRIEVLYDREHTLGHAFLMNLHSIDDLRQAFKNKILPLLEEYFYDDWQKIRWVLGAAADDFYQRQSFNNLFTDSEAPNTSEKFQRKTLDGLTAEDFQAIY